MELHTCAVAENAVNNEETLVKVRERAVREHHVVRLQAVCKYKLSQLVTSDGLPACLVLWFSGLLHVCRHVGTQTEKSSWPFGRPARLRCIWPAMRCILYPRVY